MPPLEIIVDPNSFAVLWAFVGQDRHGKQIVASPIQIPVRWVLNQNQVIDPTGNTIASTGTVITHGLAIVNMSILWQGQLADLPAVPTNLHQVIKVNSTPDIKNRNTRFDYVLMKFSDQLPTVQ